MDDLRYLIDHLTALTEAAELLSDTTPDPANQAEDTVRSLLQRLTDSINGYSISLDDLTDVSGLDVAVIGQYLTFDGSTWSPTTLSQAFVLSDATDVSETSPTSGQLLGWNATDLTWEPRTEAAGVENLNDLSDVAVASPSSGDGVEWNGSSWVKVTNNVTLANLSTYVTNAAINNMVEYTDSVSVLNDVQVSAPASGHLLAYNGTAGRFENNPPVVTTTDIAAMVTDADIAAMVTNADIAAMVTNADIAAMVTNADIAAMVTDTDIAAMVTDTDIANMVTTSVMQTALDLKEDTLAAYDTVPTDASTNIVESNGVFDALATKAAAAHTHPLSEVEQSTAATNEGILWTGAEWEPQPIFRRISGALAADFSLGTPSYSHIIIMESTSGSQRKFHLGIMPVSAPMQTALDLKEDTLPAYDTVPTNASTNICESNGIFDALAGKEPTLAAYDTTPTNGSTNICDSDGIFDALVAKMDVNAVTTVTTGSYTLAAIPVIFATAAGSITLNLPAASTKAGVIYTILRTGAGGNGVTVARAGSDTIDGATSKFLLGLYDRLVIVSDGSNWSIITSDGTF
jgi:hypothetical protein